MAEEKTRRTFSLHKEQRIRFHLLLQELKKVFQTLAVCESLEKILYLRPFVAFSYKYSCTYEAK